MERWKRYFERRCSPDLKQVRFTSYIMEQGVQVKVSEYLHLDAVFLWLPIAA